MGDAEKSFSCEEDPKILIPKINMKLILIATIFLAGVTSTLAVKCYSCQVCESGEKIKEIECASGVCMKTTTMIQGQEFSGKGCGVKVPGIDLSKGGFCKVEEGGPTSGKNCICEGDLCNGQSPLKSSAIWMVGIAAILANWLMK